MQRLVIASLLAGLALSGCDSRQALVPPPPREQTADAPPPTASTAAPAAHAPGSASAAASAAAARAPLMNDAQLGELMRKLSERPGDFPSRNFVSNETSLLDVAPALRDGRLRGRAYVGVGPEQNLTYVGLSEP
ncbi:MAG TPA: hypothetical protein PLI95_28870, partial [Polyangiaceae bacterium]|nr:hypothetical protein [Polyangiaceae bacterium]